jgi:hypothetical protein
MKLKTLALMTGGMLIGALPAVSSAADAMMAAPMTCQQMMDKASPMMSQMKDPTKMAMVQKEMDSAKMAMGKGDMDTCKTHMKMAMDGMGMKDGMMKKPG